ncbi:hypothetical protein ABN070_14555, partial [Morganella morganii]|uniref:hypothetical protein n=1 Tax=Morganella morganii TaxID=582 RepID=UPI0032DBDE8F
SRAIRWIIFTRSFLPNLVEFCMIINSLRKIKTRMTYFREHPGPISVKIKQSGWQTAAAVMC